MATSLQYNPLDPVTLSDPYPVFAELRTHCPVYWHEQMNSWVLSRYEDCRDVLRDYKTFARDWRRVGDEVPDDKLSIQGQDPPNQGVLRRQMIRSMRLADLEGMCRRARATLEGHFERLADRVEFDFMSEVAAPLALEITCELMGVNQPELAAIAQVSDALARRMDSGLDPSQAEAGVRARDQLLAMVKSWFATTELPGMIADLRDNAVTREMPDPYVQNTVGAAFNATYSTLYALTGAVIQTLMEHPDVLQRLRDPSLMATGVDELVRFTSPAQATSRVAVVQTMVGDTTIERGEVLVTLFAAANRDPDQFSRPDELILDRSPNPHLGFGWGPHICVGAPLALAWLREFVKCLQDWPAALGLAGEPKFRRTATLRSLEALPVSFQR